MELPSIRTAVYRCTSCTESLGRKSESEMHLSIQSTDDDEDTGKFSHMNRTA